MLGTFLKGASASALPLEFVGGVALNSSATQTPSYSLTGLSGGLDSAPSVGDIVIACIAFTNRINRDIQCTTSGYNKVVDLYVNNDLDCQLGVFYKILSAADTSVQFNLGTSTPSLFTVHVWRNPNTGTPLDVTPTTATAFNTGVPNAPSITTVTDNTIVIAVGAGAGNTDSPMEVNPTAPSGMGNFYQTLTSAAGAIAIASISRETAGAYDPPVFGGFTGDADNEKSSCAVTIALRPA